MDEMTQTARSSDAVDQERVESRDPVSKPLWETPKMEDVSEQVTAQPYIRFT